MKQIQLKSLRCLIFGMMLVGLTACATGGAMVNHAFGFDAFEDSPDVEVLDYKYGDGAMFGTEAERDRVALGQVFLEWHIAGVMPRGDTLYVKWRDKRTHHVYQDTVDLRNRLPRDITGLTIYFLIKGPQLYVYLIYPGLKDASVPEGPVITYRHQRQVQIYPDMPQ